MNARKKPVLCGSYLLLTLKHRFLHENIVKQPNNQFAKITPHQQIGGGAHVERIPSPAFETF
jgi:hypothetical protein